jgi:hypothetical protein
VRALLFLRETCIDDKVGVGVLGATMMALGSIVGPGMCVSVDIAWQLSRMAHIL